MRRDEENGPDPDDWLAEEGADDAPTVETSRVPGRRSARPSPATMQGRRAIGVAVLASLVVLVVLIVVLGGDGEPDVGVPTGAAPGAETGTGTQGGTDTGAAPEAEGGQALQLEGNGTLAVGASGPPVRRLQRALTQLGYEVSRDGAYGAETAAAVRRFQADEGLEVDGVVGPATLRALNAALADGGG